MVKTKFRILSGLMALVLCMSLCAVPAFAYAEDTGETTAPTEAATEPASSEDGLTISLDDILALFSDTTATVDTKVGTVDVSSSSYLNVRSGAGKSYRIIGRLLRGDQVEVIAQDGDWYKVVIPEFEGYVHGDYLDVATKSTTTGNTSFELDPEWLTLLFGLFSNFGAETPGASLPLTPDGNLNLIDDIGSVTAAGQQFVTVESKNGNVFYLIIDRNDKGEETVHFLNQVDEADLMALIETDDTPATCSCKNKCMVGAISTACPVCAINMAECMGKEPEPTVPEEPTEPTEPVEKPKNNAGAMLVLLLLVGLGGGAAYYFLKVKKTKPQTKGNADLDDYDYGTDEDEELDFEPYDPASDDTEESDE